MRPLVPLLLAGCVELQYEPMPLERAAVEVYDLGRDQNLAAAGEQALTLDERWSAFRDAMSDAPCPPRDRVVAGMDAAVAALREVTADSADGLEMARAGNAVASWTDDLQSESATGVPAMLLELQHLEREVALDALEGGFVRAEAQLTPIENAWGGTAGRLRITASRKDGEPRVSAFEATLVDLQAALAAGDADAAVIAADEGHILLDQMRWEVFLARPPRTQAALEYCPW